MSPEPIEVELASPSHAETMHAEALSAKTLRAFARHATSVSFVEGHELFEN